jgi:integrase/recombinase XerD
VKARVFTSALGPAMQQLLALRGSLGYVDGRTLIRLFASFDRFVSARNQAEPWLIREIAESWAVGDSLVKPTTIARRYAALRVLGRFLAATYPQTYVPGPGPRVIATFRPHIYTPAEIHALLDVAARVGSRYPRLFVTLLGLLYCTGLRISEALSLRLADVDFDEDLLIVRNTKFHKSRAVPLQPDAKRAMIAYVKARSGSGRSTHPDSPFFVSRRNRPCSYGWIFTNFRAILRQAGLLRGIPGQRGGPRLHDLRHTFAVHRLLAWYRDGGDVQARLPLLTTYLGHTTLASTQVYLNITAELLHEAARRFEAPALAQRAGDAV